MHRSLFVFCFLLFVTVARSQELYVFTNPASNIPAKAIVAKLSLKSMKPYHYINRREYRMMPEIQVGLTKKIQVAGAVSFSDMVFQNGLHFESARLSMKYRFYSQDQVHQHFRMAAFATGAWTNNPLVYQELNLEGDNAGLQLGVVATELIHKFAITGGLSYLQQFAQKDKIYLAKPFSSQGIQYNLSMGYLLFPRNYTSYNQMNLNLYCEFLGFKNTDLGSAYLDIAPAIQLILKSSTRINLGARYQIAGDAHRMATQSVFISLEHYFLNVLK